MGAYIPSAYDDEIRASLTLRFSNINIPPGHPAHVPGHNETFMGQMKRHHGAENMFDRHRPKPLDRVAHRLHWSLGGGGVPANGSARLRWYWLLNAASGIMPAATADKIRDAINTALAYGSGIDSIQFYVTYNTAIPLRYDLDVVDSGSVRSLTLVSNQDVQLPNPPGGAQPDPPAPSPPETPINNVLVP